MDGPKTKLYMAQGLGNISYPSQMNTNVYFAGNNTTVDSEDGALMSALAIANYAFGVNYPLYDNSLPETLFAFTMYNMYHNIMFPKLNGSQALTSLFKTMPALTRTATASLVSARAKTKGAGTAKKKSSARKTKTAKKPKTIKRKSAKRTVKKSTRKSTTKKKTTVKKKKK